MPSRRPDIELVVLGEFDVLHRVLQNWDSERVIEARWLEDPEEFSETTLRANQLIVTDTRALGIGVTEVIRRVRNSAAQPPVVLIAQPDESEQVAGALERGVDEYVLDTDQPGTSALLMQIIDRAMTKRRDLPLVGDSPGKPHFWAFLEEMPIPSKVLDADGGLLYASPSFANFLGYERDDMMGRSIFEFMHPDEIDEAKEHYRQILSDKAAIPDTGLAYGQYCLPDRRYLCRTSQDGDERVRWGILYLMPLWHADGTLQHVVGFMVDISERKKTAIALKRREEHNRAILDTTVDGMMTIDADGYLQAVNRASEEIFGYTADEIEGQHISAILEPQGDPSALEFLRSIETSADPQPVDGRHRGGQTIPLEVGVGKMRVEDSTKYTVAVRDISERVEFLKRANRADRMEAVGHFAGGIAHDFNNLLTIIKTNAFLLSEQNLVCSGLGERCLKKILKATERSTRLTGNLLSMTPESTGETHLLNITEIIGGLQDLFGSMVEEDIELELEIDDALGLIRADPGKVEQVIMNLVLNARDAMPCGGTLTVKTRNVTVKAGDSMSPRELEPGDYVLFEVRDTGRGISDEIRDRIFDPYFTTKTSGTGLGLVTVYNIVEALQGTIDVESQPGKGSAFYVYFPATDEKSEVTVFRSEPSTFDERENAEVKTILVVEDEDDIRTSLVLLLEQEDYRVLTAADGQEALEVARDYSGPIELLLTDLVMPRLNGVELAEKFSELYPDSRVIFVSGYAGEVLNRKEIGAEHIHLNKPYEVTELIETVHKAVAERSER